MTRKPQQKKRPADKKIVGLRGQWTADVGGRELAILHDTHREGMTGYFAPSDPAKTGAKFSRLTQALKENDVAVIQRDADASSTGSVPQDGYIGLFSYKDLQIGEDGSIRLTFVDRVQ